MAWSISDLFPSWGDSGERPSDNFQYDGADQVNEKHLDYLWTQVGALENEVRDALSDIDSDGDGVVDKADAGASGFTIDNDLATTELQADTDDDGLIEDYDEGEIKDGGSREVDAAELGGSSGTNGQVLQTDGAATTWASVSDTRTDVSNDGTTVVTDTIDINAGAYLTATDDGDSSASVSAREAAILDTDYAPRYL